MSAGADILIIDDDRDLVASMKIILESRASGCELPTMERRDTIVSWRRRPT